MVTLQDKVNFVDECGKKYIGFVEKVHSKDIVDISVSKKIGSKQTYLKVSNAKKSKNPHYTELSGKKEISKKKDK